MTDTVNNILIVSASVGAGHTQAAKAIAAGMHRLYPADRIEIVDFMAEENSYLNTMVKETYLKMITLSPSVYDLLYRWSQGPRQYARVENLVARAMQRSMLRLYRRHRPDIMICTHPFPCGAAAYLRRTRRIDVPLAAVITDFAVHQFWVYGEVDLYFVANRDMQDDLVTRGISAGRIYASGIPVDPAFGETVDAGPVSRELGLTDAMPTVLVMGGGLGVGPVLEAFRQLASSELPLQIIVVAGENIPLRRQLEQAACLSRHPVSVMGYTNKVRELMAAADILVTKPGALTLSEALSLSLPLVLFSPLPGQEADNAGYLAGRGAALLVDRLDRLGDAVTGLLSQPERLAAMRENASRLGQPEAAETAARMIGGRLLGRGLAAGI
ncbi:MAG: glycosyltransferase [Negativicutes bacterium]|nr:glycosyltransferase [Negativicutes bacterium]